MNPQLSTSLAATLGSVLAKGVLELSMDLMPLPFALPATLLLVNVLGIGDLNSNYVGAQNY